LFTERSPVGSGRRGVHDDLTARGYAVSIVQNPLTSFDVSVAATRRVRNRQDGPAILVGHSFGGSVITHGGWRRSEGPGPRLRGGIRSAEQSRKTTGDPALVFRQSSYEGEFTNWTHEAIDANARTSINPAGPNFIPIPILDALKMSPGPSSDIHVRQSFASPSIDRRHCRHRRPRCPRLSGRRRLPRRTFAPAGTQSTKSSAV
jgi:3-dehydroquinate dehydratase